MTDLKQRAPAHQQGLFDKPAATTRPAQKVSSVKDRKPTQRDRVLAMLMDRDAVCGSDFYSARLPRATARIFELKRDGFVIERRRCTRAHDHESPMFEWTLVAMPQGRS